MCVCVHLGANEFDVNCNFMRISFSFSCVSFTPAPSPLAPPSSLTPLLFPSVCPAVRVIDNDLDCGFSVGVVFVLLLLFCFRTLCFSFISPLRIRMPVSVTV